MAQVVCRVLRAGQFEASTCLSVTETDQGQVATFISNANVARLMKKLSPHGAIFRRAGRGLVVRLPGGLPSDPAEGFLFAGRHVLLSLRNQQTVKATKDWLNYHAAFDVSGALIFVRGRPIEVEAFAAELPRDLPLGMQVAVVGADIPLGTQSQNHGRDATNVWSIDAAPDSSLGIDPWQSRLAEEVIYETLRHRFLSEVASVATLDIGDYLMPNADSVFLRAVAASGRAVKLRGREAYAWSASAEVIDHVYVRRSDTRLLAGWATSPRNLPEDAVMLKEGITGVKSEVPPSTFVRVMGHHTPTAGFRDTVDHRDLVEDYEISRRFEATLRKSPTRRPSRQNGSPRRPVVVVTTMKNEGPYIVDWIAHHRVVGIDDFLVYTNDCSDDTNGILSALAREGIVQHRENPFRVLGGAPQRAAFRAAKTESTVTTAAWLLPLDVDEYLNIHVGEGTVTDLFEAVPEATVISMPWRLFGNADVEELLDTPVTEQFRCGAPDYSPRPLQAWGFKTLFANDASFEKIGVHAPRRLVPERKNDVVWVDAKGRPFPEAHWDQAWRTTPLTWGYELCQINHYAVRSAEGFLIKRERGRTNHTKQDQGIDYWFRMNFNGPEERSIDRYADRVALERRQLMSIPGVAEAHTKSVAWHRRRAADLKGLPDFSTLWNEITGRRMRALSRRLPHFGNNVFILGPHVVPEGLEDQPIDGDWTFTVPLPEGHGQSND